MKVNMTQVWQESLSQSIAQSDISPSFMELLQPIFDMILGMIGL